MVGLSEQPPSCHPSQVTAQVLGTKTTLVSAGEHLAQRPSAVKIHDAQSPRPRILTSRQLSCR